MGDVHFLIRQNREFRKLKGDPDFEVIVDFGGQFFRALVGDSANGFRAPRRTRTLEAAIAWLQARVLELYPQSRYVRELSRRGTVLPFRVAPIAMPASDVSSAHEPTRKLG